MDYMTTAEVAEYFRTSPDTCRYWRHIGYGPPNFRVGRRVLYPRADVVAWAEQQRAETGSGEQVRSGAG